MRDRSRPGARRRTVRCRTGPDDGLTLIEMMVTMVVFSIAIAMVYSALILVQSKTQLVQDSAAATSQVRLALAQIDRQVRSGNVLYSPINEQAFVASCADDGVDSGSCMRVYTQANGSERCVQWQVVGDGAHPGTSILRTRSWATNWTTGGPSSDWGTVARGLVVPAGSYPFTLEGAATAYNARLLNVRFEAQDPRRDDPVVIGSSLSGRNTNYGYDAGQCTPVPPE